MMARALATNGARRIYICGRRLSKLQEAASSHPSILIPVECDVTSKDSLASLASQVEREVGFVHLVIANSGISGPGVAELPSDAKESAKKLQAAIWDKWSAEEFTRTFEVNVTAAFFTAIAFLSLLDEGNKGENKVNGVQSQVVITGSIASFIRLVVSGFAYVSSKAAVVHMMKALATYLAPFGIRVNAICPGFFKSEMTADVLPKMAMAMTGTPDKFNGTFCPAERAGEGNYLITNLHKFRANQNLRARYGWDYTVSREQSWCVSKWVSYYC